MANPKEVQQNQTIQSAQQGVSPFDFDPDIIMKEVIQKDMQNQIKEQELAIKEEELLKAVGGIQKQQATDAKAAKGASQEAAATGVTPVAPTTEKPMPPAPAGAVGAAGAAAGGGAAADISPQTMSTLQPGQKITVTKKLVMTPNGPVEVGRSENIGGATTQ